MLMWPALQALQPPRRHPLAALRALPGAATARRQPQATGTQESALAVEPIRVGRPSLQQHPLPLLIGLCRLPVRDYYAGAVNRIRQVHSHSGGLADASAAQLRPASRLLGAEIGAVAFAPAAEVVEEFAQLSPCLGELVRRHVHVGGCVFDEAVAFE